MPSPTLYLYSSVVNYFFLYLTYVGTAVAILFDFVQIERPSTARRKSKVKRF